MAAECDDAAKKVDRAKVHLRWCIESGESECGLRMAKEGLLVADEEFDRAISDATMTQREAFIITTKFMRALRDPK